jgi:hypothetical protein
LWEFFLLLFKIYLFITVFFHQVIMSHRDRTKYGCASHTFIFCFLTSTTTNPGKWGCKTNDSIASQVSLTLNTKVSTQSNIKITNYAFAVRLPQTEERASTGQMHMNGGASKGEGTHSSSTNMAAAPTMAVAAPTTAAPTPMTAAPVPTAAAPTMAAPTPTTAAPAPMVAVAAEWW